MPAVSIKRKSIPSIFRTSSIVSRVVPAISLTIALLSFNRVFNKVDFPAFGLPMIATLTPFLITLPKANDDSKPEVILLALSINW